MIFIGINDADGDTAYVNPAELAAVEITRSPGILVVTFGSARIKVRGFDPRTWVEIFTSAVEAIDVGVSLTMLVDDGTGVLADVEPVVR